MPTGRSGPVAARRCMGHGGRRDARRRPLRKIARPGARLGIEPPFLPSDAHAVLQQLGNRTELVDATSVFERLRAVKTPEELEKLRAASELITDSMLAMIERAGEGSTKTEIIEQLRKEETKRGLHFEYCLLTLGPSHNRAASPQTWQKGEVLSIDSGGNYHGYIGDLCRMACWANRMPNWRICWRRSTPCSRRPSPRCGPARSAAT